MEFDNLIEENIEIVENLMKDLLGETQDLPKATASNVKKEEEESEGTNKTNATNEDVANPSYVMLEPKCVGKAKLFVKTQIQTNRRTNFYLDANWPPEMLNKKFPIFYFPPVDNSIHDHVKNLSDPSAVWLSEMFHYLYGTNCYMEVQFWVKKPNPQLILKCNAHPTVIKLPGQPYDEKMVSHGEAKWARNTLLFGINFNCTKTCFKSDIYLFIRVRCGNVYMESDLMELPFRRSEKRKSDAVAAPTPAMPMDSMDLINPSKRQIVHARTPTFNHNPEPFAFNTQQQPLLSEPSLMQLHQQQQLLLQQLQLQHQNLQLQIQLQQLKQSAASTLAGMPASYPMSSVPSLPQSLPTDLPAPAKVNPVTKALAAYSLKPPSSLEDHHQIKSFNPNELFEDAWNDTAYANSDI